VKALKTEQIVKQVPIGTSNRHIHLSSSDLRALFGENHVLTPQKALSQPGQFTAKETVTLVGPKVDHSEGVAAIALRGRRTMSFADINILAQGLLLGLVDYLCSDKPLILVIEADCGKVLGQCINALANRPLELVCIDQLEVENCDYIDIGKPLMGGRVVPVVLKTLVFNR